MEKELKFYEKKILNDKEFPIQDVYKRQLQRIIVCTNSNLVAPKNYESVGFKLYNRKENNTESAYTGAYLYYSMNL